MQGYFSDYYSVNPSAAGHPSHLLLPPLLPAWAAVVAGPSPKAPERAEAAGSHLRQQGRHLSWEPKGGG